MVNCIWGAMGMAAVVSSCLPKVCLLAGAVLIGSGILDSGKPFLWHLKRPESLLGALGWRVIVLLPLEPPGATFGLKVGGDQFGAIWSFL